MVIILAPEGINGNLCGIIEAMGKVSNFIQSPVVTPEDETIHDGHTSRHSPVGRCTIPVGSCP